MSGEFWNGVVVGGAAITASTIALIQVMTAWYL